MLWYMKAAKHEWDFVLSEVMCTYVLFSTLNIIVYIMYWSAYCMSITCCSQDQNSRWRHHMHWIYFICEFSSVKLKPDITAQFQCCRKRRKWSKKSLIPLKKKKKKWQFPEISKRIMALFEMFAQFSWKKRRWRDKQAVWAFSRPHKWASADRSNTQPRCDLKLLHSAAV